MIAMFTRSLLVWCAAVLVAGCSQTVVGRALMAVPGIDEDSRSPVDVDTIMLDQSQMRAITGAGEHLTVIPSMEGKIPVDVYALIDSTPPECQWFFAETKTFGPDVEEFHKTTFQNPPDHGLISEGAAAYRDPDTARRAFGDLVGLVANCASSGLGSTFIGDWTADSESLRIRSTGVCGRDYRMRSVVVVEVTFCGFPDSVPDIVVTNIVAKVPD
jgi:hypothetical protein